ncbi:MAG: SHOCT domain-containing protein [Nanoarchaeota archaeon]|nr:SHOCT domain-containing protein [Nanoarchaeota archaeon]
MKKNDNNALVWIFIAVIVVLFLIGGFGMGGYSTMGFGMGFGFLFMLLFWGVIIWLIVTLINSSQSNKKDDLDSITILRRRYARGEITKKQFEKMKKEIGV